MHFISKLIKDEDLSPVCPNSHKLQRTKFSNAGFFVRNVYLFVDTNTTNCVLFNNLLDFILDALVNQLRLDVLSKISCYNNTSDNPAARQQTSPSSNSSSSSSSVTATCDSFSADESFSSASDSMTNVVDKQ